LGPERVCYYHHGGAEHRENKMIPRVGIKNEDNGGGFNARAYENKPTATNRRRVEESGAEGYLPRAINRREFPRYERLARSDYGGDHLSAFAYVVCRKQNEIYAGPTGRSDKTRIQSRGERTVLYTLRRVSDRLDLYAINNNGNERPLRDGVCARLPR